MEADEPRLKAEAALQAVMRQDLSPLSVDELHERIAMLEIESARTRSHAEKAVNHRASADAIFKR